MGVHAWVCMVMPVVCWVVLFRYGGLGSFDLARLLSVAVRPSPLPACVRAHVCDWVVVPWCSWCVRWWWLFSSVCRAGVSTRCWGLPRLWCTCGVHMSLRVCGLSACSSGVRVVSVCCVRVLRFVRVFVSLLVEQGRA